MFHSLKKMNNNIKNKKNKERGDKKIVNRFTQFDLCPFSFNFNQEKSFNILRVSIETSKLYN